MRAQRILAVDCDGVLLDWDGAFAPFASYYLRRPIKGRPTNWNMDDWLGTDAMPVIEAFNSSEAFGYIGPTAAAEQVVPDLLGRGFKLGVISSCSDSSVVVQRRYTNLCHVFGAEAIAWTICLPLGVSKSATLEHLQRVHGPCFWVEDNYKNAQIGLDAGHCPIMVRQPWNAYYEADDQSCAWVDDWHQIKELVS